MTNKRFRQFGLWCFDKEQDKYLDVALMVGLLNTLQEENEETIRWTGYE